MAKWATQRFEYYAPFSHSASCLLVQQEPVEYLLSMKIYHSTPWLMGMPWSPPRSGHRAGVTPVESVQHSVAWAIQRCGYNILSRSPQPLVHGINGRGNIAMWTLCTGSVSVNSTSSIMGLVTWAICLNMSYTGSFIH